MTFRDISIKRQVGHDLLQTVVLVSRAFRTHLIWQQPAIPLLPVEVGHLTDSSLAADLGDLRAFLALLQNNRLLRFRELRCLHRSQLLSQPGNISRKLQFQTLQFSGQSNFICHAAPCYGMLSTFAECRCCAFYYGKLSAKCRAKREQSHNVYERA